MPTSCMVNAVYYPSWKVYKGYPPSTIPLQDVTHIFYAFARVNADGTLRYLDEFGDLEKPVDGVQGCLAALAQLKQVKPTVKLILSIGGGSGSEPFPVLARGSRSRESLAVSARAWVDRHGFDGIDIDWEHPKTPEDGANYIRLLEAARHQLPAPRYLLTTALPVGLYCLRVIDLKAAARSLDYINLMAYDFVGSWTDVSGHHAQLFPAPHSSAESGRGDGSSSSTNNATVQKSVSTGLQYLIHEQGFPSGKILLGIPAYARYFPGARGPGQPFHKHIAGELEYRDIPTHWIRGATVDLANCTACFIDDDGGDAGKGFISFDVPATVEQKARYTRDHGLGGIFFWASSGDRDIGDPDNLVAAGVRGLAAEA
ncbi:glycoside hydrolase family 18 protein [Xylariales sp. PMI_506]|nr:glycoside hydrolase family 18 protein [Xylariales sp. PMI_506]